MENGYSVIVLAGTPRAGKSTLFNRLTGMRRHAGSWRKDEKKPEKGTFRYSGATYLLYDLPGSSLAFPSRPDIITVVADATRLEPGLHLLKQILSMDTGHSGNIPVVLCVNFHDEATRTGLAIDYSLLEDVLQIPVIPCCAGNAGCLDDLKAAVHYAAKPENRRLLCCIPDFSPKRLAHECISASSPVHSARRVILDSLLTGPVAGRLIPLFILAAVLRLAMAAAGSPVLLLWNLLYRAAICLKGIMTYLEAPPWLTGCLVQGGFHALSWTIAVMLPPLAVFLFCFTLLEDLGFLPRASCAMDPVFSKCGSCGGHCVSMALGLGCSAAGAVCCRSIRSPRERLTAVLTSSILPCSGRFPVFIVLIPLFFAAGPMDSFTGSLSCSLFFALLLLAAVFVTMGTSRLLSGTLLKRFPSAPALELPPYRKIRLSSCALRSFWDRTMVFTLRAAAASFCAGILIWFLNRPAAGAPSLLDSFTRLLDPAAGLLGMDGVILAAFILSFPAGELFLPILLTAYLGNGSPDIASCFPDMVNGAFPLYQLLASHGWTWITALCTLVFTLFHWPCLTACRAVAREAGGWKWTAAAVLTSTLTGTLLCMGIALLSRI